MAFTKITQAELNSRGATTLDNKPQKSAQDLKIEFDAPAKQIVAPALNNLVDELSDTTASANIGAESPTSRSGGTTVQSNLNKLSSDLALVETDSHTHSNKDVLDTITEDVVMDEDYVHTDNNYSDTDKATVDAAVTDEDYVHTDNNYTTSEKNKLATIDEYANNYVLPVGNTVTIGGVKADGSTTTIDTDGTIHAVGGGGGGGASNAYKTIKVGTTDIIASGEDTITFEQGANVTLTPNAVTKTIRISATGGQGGGGGDMYQATYDTNGDGIVNSADTINGLTATVTELNYTSGVTSAIQSQLDALSISVGTKADKTVTSGLRTDVDSLIDKAQNLNSSGQISSDDVLYGSGSTSITNQIQNLDSDGKLDYSKVKNAPTVDQTYNATSTNPQSGVAVASAVSGKVNVSDVKTLAEIQSASTFANGDVTSASAIKDLMSVNANETQIGTWLGKPLYRRVIYADDMVLPTVTTNGTKADSSYSYSITNIDKIVRQDGFFIKATDGVTIPFFARDDSLVYCSKFSLASSTSGGVTTISSIKLVHNFINWNGAKAYITIEYTKAN